MPAPVQQYYEILGVTRHSSLAQVKAAYRRKAKLLHPDVNKSKDAGSRFILLNEAREYLETRKFYETKTAPSPGNKASARRSKKGGAAYRDAREASRRHKHHWGVVGLHALLDYMIFTGVLAVYLVVLTFGTLYQGTPGLIAGLFCILVTLPHAITGVRNYQKQRIR
jgi:hypothetical protein